MFNKHRMTGAIIGAFLSAFILYAIGLQEQASDVFCSAVLLIWLRICMES